MPAASSTAASSQPQAPNPPATAGAATAASASTASRSAARSATADAATGAVGSGVRRSTLVTRSASPSRNGSRWLPSNETCSAAHDCPADRPGSTRRQAHDRSTNAPA